MARMSGNHSPQRQDAIRRRSPELYQRGGAVEGHNVENWYQAEAEPSANFSHSRRSPRRRR
jgi:hypothetical protein